MSGSRCCSSGGEQGHVESAGRSIPYSWHTQPVSGPSAHIRGSIRSPAPSDRHGHRPGPSCITAGCSANPAGFAPQSFSTQQQPEGP